MSAAVQTSPDLGPPGPGIPGRRLRRPDRRPSLRRPATGEPDGWRRWRLPLTLVALFALAGLAIAVAVWHPKSNSYLDPADSGPQGTSALSDLLGERGFTVVRAYSPASALAAIGSPGAGPSAATLVITSPDLLAPRQLAQLRQARADLVIMAPGPRSLRTLAPHVFVASFPTSSSGRVVRPNCGLRAATLAGPANVAGYTYGAAPPQAASCYQANGGDPSLVRYPQAGRTITILGGDVALSNGYLARNGNAALALNLLSGQHLIVWLTPEPAVAPAASGPGSSPGRQVPPLLPARVWLFIAELCVALALTIIWRARRFGPLIAENLPVVVRASETVEGHARLYQSRRARDRAASALRSAMLARVRPALGVATDAAPEAVAAVLSGRSRLSQQEIAGIIYGPTPASDAELVDLARNLDELEREVRSQ